jgi:hypothetical protein
LRKIAIVIAAALSIALVGASLANAGNPTSDEHAKNLAAKQCAAEKKADKGAFKATYGEHAMRNCVQGTQDETKQKLEKSAQACQDERAEDPDAFKETYGTEQSQGRNAFGKCVSSKAKAKVKREVREFDNAAKECKDERAEDSDAFKETYDTEHSDGRNALGKCVSQKVKHSDDEETTTS